MESKTIEERLIKAIDFFRKFDNLSDKDIYRRSVLRFCDLVEEYLSKPKSQEEEADEVFK
jgi:hypothetical protein